MRKSGLILTLSFLIFQSSFAQTDTIKRVPDIDQELPGLVADTSSMVDDDSGSLLGDLEPEAGPDYVQNVFKGIRVINSNSTEMIGPKNLDFRICHRFGAINLGPYDMFGLDEAYQRISFTFGLHKLVNLEVGRSSFGKMYDASAKVKFMSQANKDKKRPISLVYWFNTSVTAERVEQHLKPYKFSNRLYYTHQLIASKKFSKGFSLQIMPTLLHRNLVDSVKYSNDVFCLGVAGRNKLTRKTAITYEYFYVLPNQINPQFHNSFSIGFDIETGGHVFQLHFTNGRSMNEKGFLAESQGNWLKGDINFGFNISRVFYLGRY